MNMEMEVAANIYVSFDSPVLKNGLPTGKWNITYWEVDGESKQQMIAGTTDQIIKHAKTYFKVKRVQVSRYFNRPRNFI